MFKKLLFFISSLAVLAMPLQAQQRTCATMSNLDRLEQQFPGTKARMIRNDNLLQQRVLQKSSGTTGKSAAVVTIPVVVHVVYRNATQNISQAQIQSQIDVLNEDYRKLNADTVNIPGPFKQLAGDTEIQFELAKRDPNGDPTNGITRTATTKSAFVDDDAVKFTSRGGKDAWDRDKYLNIWVCNLGGGLLGYAQFPGSGPAATDGVVAGFDCFGRTGTASSPFNKGRTITHEVGHWLSLYHIWGDEPGCNADDQVSDTPQQKRENYGCPTFPQTTANGGSCSGVAPGSMFMNYMDYTNDACMYMFTNGQALRVQSAMQMFRPTLATSNGAVPVTVLPYDASIFAVESPVDYSCFTQITPKVVLKNRGSNPLTSATITYTIDGGPAQTYQWTGNLASFATTTVSLPAQNVAAGNHSIVVSSSLPNGQTDNDLTNDSLTKSFVTAQQTPGVGLPFSESFETATFPPAGWTRNNPDNDISWARTNRAWAHGTRSAFMNFYDYYYTGEVDELISLPINVGSVSAPMLAFQIAYAPTSFNANPGDTLEVLASIDCGVTYTSLYKKTGQQLTTTGTTVGNPFTPTAQQWRTETVSLQNFAANNNVILKFRATTGYENNLYLDDIRVGVSLGVNEGAAANPVAIFPNPTSGLFTIEAAKPFSGNTAVSVKNNIGQEIFRQAVRTGESKLELNLNQLPAGVYLVHISNGQQSTVHKVVVVR